MNKTTQKAWKGVCVKCGKIYRNPPTTEADMEYNLGQCDECWNRTVESHTSRLIGKVLTEKELRD